MDKADRYARAGGKPGFIEWIALLLAFGTVKVFILGTATAGTALEYVDQRYSMYIDVWAILCLLIQFLSVITYPLFPRWLSRLGWLMGVGSFAALSVLAVLFDIGGRALELNVATMILMASAFVRRGDYK
jgi:hypothetical protein